MENINGKIVKFFISACVNEIAANEMHFKISLVY